MLALPLPKPTSLPSPIAPSTNGTPPPRQPDPQFYTKGPCPPSVQPLPLHLSTLLFLQQQAQPQSATHDLVLAPNATSAATLPPSLASLPPPTTPDSQTAPIVPNLSQRVQKEVHHALGVMEKTSVNGLNYRQLLRHPDYHADWAKSSADEFGCLANRVGGRIKGTQTIKVIRKYNIPKDRRKDITAKLSAKSVLKSGTPTHSARWQRQLHQ
eukprot:CCRYP_014589-RA/>CCRYP_014589-RA protein AED:0.67 eAED:0.49 QI:0/0/0/0.33/1/1/3/0/211